MFVFYTAGAVYICNRAKKVRKLCDEVLWVPIYTIVFYQSSIRNRHPMERALYIGKFLHFTEHFQAQAVNLIVKIVLWHWCISTLLNIYRNVYLLCVWMEHCIYVWGVVLRHRLLDGTSISKLILRSYGKLHR